MSTRTQRRRCSIPRPGAPAGRSSAAERLHRRPGDPADAAACGRGADASGHTVVPAAGCRIGRVAGLPARCPKPRDRRGVPAVPRLCGCRGRSPDTRRGRCADAGSVFPGHASVQVGAANRLPDAVALAVGGGHPRSRVRVAVYARGPLDAGGEPPFALTDRARVAPRPATTAGRLGLRRLPARVGVSGPGSGPPGCGSDHGSSIPPAVTHHRGKDGCCDPVPVPEKVVGHAPDTPEARYGMLLEPGESVRARRSAAKG